MAKSATKKQQPVETLDAIFTKTHEKHPRKVTIVPQINKEKKTLQFGVAICDPNDEFSETAGINSAQLWLKYGLRAKEVPLPKKSLTIKEEIVKFRKQVEKHPNAYRKLNNANRILLRIEMGRL